MINCAARAAVLLALFAEVRVHMIGNHGLPAPRTLASPGLKSAQLFVRCTHRVASDPVASMYVVGASHFDLFKDSPEDGTLCPDVDQITRIQRITGNGA